MKKTPPVLKNIIQFLFVLCPILVLSQTTIINPTTNGGFENGNTFVLNGWTATTGGTNPLNHWVCNTGATTGFSGTRCAYITRTGTNHDYNVNNARASHLYRNISIPAGESNIILSFNWMGIGENSLDKMRIWLVPTTVTPVYGTPITASGTIPTGNIQIGATNYSNQGTWTSTTFNLPTAYAGTTFRIVFEWTNNANTGTAPPAAIDNISLTSQAPVIPTNNECLTATNLTVNSTTNCTTSTNGTTAFATQSLASCTGSADDDVWYSFVATNSNHIITVTPTTLNNVVFQVFSGTCTGLTSLACINNTTGSSPETTTLTGLTIGTIYQIRVHSNANGSGQGSFNICITTPPPPPSNNLCTNAISLPCSTTNLAGTTVNSLDINPNSGCAMSNFGVWYTFVGDGYPTTISSTAAYDHEMSIVSGNCGTLTNITCQDFSTSGGTESFTFTTVAATTYYVYIAHYAPGDTSTATFTISRSCVTCLPPTAIAPTNLTFTSATVNWNPPSYTPSNGYQYAVTTNATPPTSGTATTATSINTTGLTANTTYYLHVRSDCGTTNGFSNWSTISFTTGYCTPAPSSVDGTGITNVTIGTINNNSGSESGNYGNYSALSTSGSQGETLPFSIRFATAGFAYDVIIWVDWNNDLDFNDLGEQVFSGISPATNPGIITGNFQIPPSALLGNHRLRIGGLDSAVPTPCYTGTYGTYEDYTLNVISAACPGPSNLTVFISTQTTATINWNTAIPVPSNGYDYYITTSSAIPNGTTTPTGAVASGITTLNLTGLTPGTTYYIWIRSNCGGTNGFWIGTSFIAPLCTIGNGTGTTALACPSVVSGGLGLAGGDPTPITCGSASTCVDLEASYLQIGETTNYTVSSIPYTPPYQFSCLKNPVSVNIDDRWSPIINLPFNFCFYGNNYNQCIMSSNGVISFDTTSNTPGGYSDYSFSSNLPSTSLFTNAIFGVYQDIDPSISGEVGWELITLNTGCRALVASWSNIPMYSSTCNSQLYTGMMVLYENTNIIEVYIQEKNVCSTWNSGNAVVGIQNANGTQAVVAPNRNSLDPDWSVTNEAFRFTPSGASISTITWHEGSGTAGPILGYTDIINVCPTTTTTYTAEIEYTLCNGTTLIETDEVTVIVGGNKTWNGSTNTNWNIASNWTPSGVPLSTDCVVIPNVTNDPIVNGVNYNGLGRSLTVNANASLTITPTNSIRITNAINVNPTGTIIVQDDASIVQINNVTNTGNIQYMRTALIRKQDYVYWSSPVSNFASNAVSPGTGLGFQYKWLPTTAATNNFGNWTYANETMILGKGYCVRGPNTFSPTVVANYTASFIGVPNNGDISIPISRGTYNGINYATGVSTTLGTRDDDNWNLVGNPYPSAISAIDFLTLNTNIAGFVNIWTHGTLPSNAILDPFYANYAYNYTPTDYITYNLLGASTGAGIFNGFIAGGQGFFVSMLHTSSSTTENLNFNNSLRSSSHNNTVFYKSTDQNNTKTDEIEKHRIWFDLVNSYGNSTRALIGYATTATDEKDRLFDAFSNEKLTFNIFSLIQEEQMLIQGKALPFNTKDKVNIGISIPEDGQYKIALSNVDGLFSNPKQNIYLEDKELNVILNLKEVPYSFFANKGTITDRFLIRYTKSDVITEITNQLSIYDNSILTIESSKLKIKDIVIYDTLGKMLLNKNNVNNTNYQISNLNRTNSMLIIKVTLEDNIEEIRKIMY